MRAPDLVFERIRSTLTFGGMFVPRTVPRVALATTVDRKSTTHDGMTAGPKMPPRILSLTQSC